MNYNKVVLLGRVTRDIELRFTPGGTAVADFSLAVNHIYKKQDGEKVEEVSFIDITAFGKQAETLEKYVGKGKALLVEGRLKQDRWETEDGKNRSKLKVSLDSFQFISGGKKEEDTEYDDGGIPDDDIPF